MRSPQRRRPSSIDRLDPEIKDLIGKLRIDHGWTIDEIRSRLLELDPTSAVSRSALGRHVKSLQEIGDDLRNSREVANALIAKVGDAPENKTAQLNIELMQSMLMTMMTSVNADGDGKAVKFGPMEVMLLSKTLQQLSSAQKTNVDIVARARDEGRKAALAEAKKKIESGAKDGQIDPEAAARAKRLLGFD